MVEIWRSKLGHGRNMINYAIWYTVKADMLWEMHRHIFLSYTSVQNFMLLCINARFLLFPTQIRLTNSWSLSFQQLWCELKMHDSYYFLHKSAWLITEVCHFSKKVCYFDVNWKWCISDDIATFLSAWQIYFFCVYTGSMTQTLQLQNFVGSMTQLQNFVTAIRHYQKSHILSVKFFAF